jgi:predicted DNA-binding transcriptional regulator AlpA
MASTKQQTPVERARAQMEQWQAQFEESTQTPSYLHLSPMELIAMAESPRRLKPEELEALDGAWLKMFGEPLCQSAGERTGDGSAPVQAAEPEPEPADVDANVPGWKAAAHIAGVSVATLRRMVLDGRFPEPRRVSERRVGWPVGEVRAWRDRLDANRRRG